MPKNLFNGFHNLRIVDLANNEFRLLRENIFKDSTVERLDMSSNHLAKVPLFSFYGDTGRTLLELDLSGNMIGTLPTPDVFIKFRVGLLVEHNLLYVHVVDEVRCNSLPSQFTSDCLF